MMNQLYNTLPDDRPITNINIIEDPEKCPQGFVVVHKTHDHDSDADLWREASFFGRRLTRYICMSKTEGINDYIVESLTILNEKEVPPDGYTLLPRTADTEQKAWRKRQLCYRLSKRALATYVVTDIIVLSRMKKAPDGFSLAGEINGMTVCYKVRASQAASPGRPMSVNPALMYSITPQPGPGLPPPKLAPLRPYSLPPAPAPPTNGNSTFYAPPAESSDSMYERLKPSRPAPKPPELTHQTSYATIMSYHELDGIPFMLSPSLHSQGIITPALQIPKIKAKSRQQLDQEYGYDFRTERQT